MPAAAAAKEPLLRCGNCREPMQRLALAGHYGTTVEIDLCAHCDWVWFDALESARLNGPALLALIGVMAESHALPHQPLRRDPRCPRCDGHLGIVHNQSRWGRSSQLQCERRHGAYQSFAQFLGEKGLLRPMSRLDRARLLQSRGRVECVNCGGDIGAADEQCRFCRSVPSLLDVARLARALDPLETIEPQAVYATATKQAAMQCAACGAALSPDDTMTCSQCGATLAITSLAEANASVQALAPALRAAAEKPSPAVVKRKLEALDADLPRRREWAATMEAEAREQRTRSSGESYDFTQLFESGTNPLRAVFVALAIWFAWYLFGR